MMDTVTVNNRRSKFILEQGLNINVMLSGF